METIKWFSTDAHDDQTTTDLTGVAGKKNLSAALLNQNTQLGITLKMEII